MSCVEIPTQENLSVLIKLIFIRLNRNRKLRLYTVSLKYQCLTLNKPIHNY